MTNPEYENKVSPTELYNDEIIQQFESIRNVIHKEILPSTYNELVVTSNQAGTLTNYMDLKTYPASEIIFPLSPQSGNINWLDKNFLRFRFNIKQSNTVSSAAYPLGRGKIPLYLFGTNTSYVEMENQAYLYDSSNTRTVFQVNGSLGVIDPASIFKSIELNYGGTAIWTSAYQQVEAFFTYASLPNQLVSSCQQYIPVGGNPRFYDQLKYSGQGSTTSLTSSYTFYIDIDISRLSPILSWMSIIPGFINKLSLRVVIDAPSNWLTYGPYAFCPYMFSKTSAESAGVFNWGGKRYPLSNAAYNAQICMPLDGCTWNCDLCEIHQCNATMTEDTRIRLIALIQQLGGKWIYPCRYWNTAIAPIQTFSTGNGVQVNLQFVLTGCYFRCLAFAQQTAPTDTSFIWSPGNGIFAWPSKMSSIEIYCDSELLVSYPELRNAYSDTNNALMDEDKYSIPFDVQNSIENGWNYFGWHRTCIIKATGPPNGMYSGRYTSEKMGTHNIILKYYCTDINLTGSWNCYCWCGALQDGVIVFDNFNGSYFATGRKMQQVYEALS